MKNMRKPKVKNKYNLTVAKVKKLKVNRTKMSEHLDMFWRNNVISAYCWSKSIKGDGCWLGIYDEDAERYAGKFRVYFTAYDGMCSYNFEKFFDYREIEYEYDLEIQEVFLEKINELIDLGILYME